MPATSAERTPAELLDQALRENDVDQVRYWLIAGASLTIKIGPSRHSVLGRWVATGNPALWRVLAPYACHLLEHTPRNGFCALAVAAAGDRLPMVQVLLDAGARIDGPELNGNNPLMTAVRSNALGALALLLERGARVDVRTLAGNTVLHEAALHSSVEDFPAVIARLLAAGADPDPINHENKTVADVIRTENTQKSMDEIAQRLVQWEQAVLRATLVAALPDDKPLPAEARVRL